MEGKIINPKPSEDNQFILRSAKELEKHYGEPGELAVLKVKDFLDENSRAFIEAAPFVVLATSDKAGNLDCSPRGDYAGFVRVLDEKTLLIPDRRGNNRIDSLKNIVENQQVALLFFVPNVNETFRVNGTAQISVAPGLLEQFTVKAKTPKTVLIITIREAFVQCSRALVRADLWQPEKYISATEKVPTMGTILATNMNGKFDPGEYDRELPERVRKTLY